MTLIKHTAKTLIRPRDALKADLSLPRGATKDDFSGQFFHIFEIIIFCFVVAIYDLVHAVKAMYSFL